MTSVPSTSQPTKGERTRQAILDAATASFANTGRRDTSIPSIARTVDITASAVYAYFPTKQALFEAALDADAAGLIADALPEVMAGDDFEIDFADVFARLTNALPAHPLARRVLAGNEPEGVERIAKLPSELRLHHALAALLRRGQADGSIRADVDAEHIAIGLDAIVTSVLMGILQTNHADAATSRGVLAVLDAAIRPYPIGPAR